MKLRNNILTVQNVCSTFSITNYFLYVTFCSLVRAKSRGNVSVSFPRPTKWAGQNNIDMIY